MSIEKTRGLSQEERRKRGREIRELRLSLGLTQRQFAERIGVDQQAVSNWERGENSPNRATRNAILQTFNKVAGVHESEIIWGENDSPDQKPRAKLIREIKVFAEIADIDLIEALLKNVKAFSELMKRRRALRG